MNLSVQAAENLNRGLLRASSLKKLRLNLCIHKREILLKIMPALTQPGKLPLDELNLAANGMGDSEFGQLVARLITTHCEYRD